MAERKDRQSTRSRTYDDIKREILESLAVLAPNWTSHGVDEPGIAILEILAGISDGLFFNLDRQARESFLTTAVLPESVHSLAHLLHYRPKRWIAAQGDIILNVTDIDENESEEVSGDTRTPIVLPALSAVTAENGRPLVTTEAISLGADFSGQLAISALQGIYRTYVDNVTPENIYSFILPDVNIAEQLFEVYINNELWYDATDHPLDSALDRFYFIRKNPESRYEISFRSTRGRVPSYGSSIEVRYVETAAENVPAGILSASEPLTSGEGINWSHTDFTNSSPPETLEQIADRAPAKNSTADRAVTLGDYKELAKQIPNVKAVYVAKSKVGWNTSEVYVATVDGDAASNELLLVVKEFFEKRNNLVVSVRSYPAIYRRFVLSCSLRIRAGFNAARIRSETISVLEKTYSYDKLSFGQAIRISDVYGILESIPGVDYSNISALHWVTQNSDVRNLVPTEAEYPILYSLDVTLE